MRDVPIEDPPVEDLGPAMLALNEHQRRFVVGWLRSNGKNASRVARAAGYSGKGGADRVRAHYLLQNPKVGAALREEAERDLNGPTAARAFLKLKELSSHPNPKISRPAADSVLDRAGIARQTNQKIQMDVTDTRTDRELIAGIVQMARLHGLDPKQLLGPDVIEAEFEEVPVGTSAG